MSARPVGRRSAPASRSAPPDHLRTAKRERTRAALIDAALGLIAERGLEAAGIDETVRQAGMARGTFYNYFQSRDELITAVIQHMLERLDARVENRLQLDWNAATRVACMMLGYVQTGLNDRRLGWALTQMGTMHCRLADRRVQDRQVVRAINELTGTQGRPEVALTLLTGVATLTLTRALQSVITLEEVRKIIAMALRALGTPAAQIGPAMRHAAEFAASIGEPAPAVDMFVPRIAN